MRRENRRLQVLRTTGPPPAPGNSGEEKLLPATVSELQAVGLAPREIALDGGFPVRATQQALKPIEPARVFIAGRPRPAPPPVLSDQRDGGWPATEPAPTAASAS